MDRLRVADEWLKLLDDPTSRDERVLQRFLERHPLFLPGSHTLDTNSGASPWPHAVISQPRLPALSAKVPDFLWIAHDSVFLYPILIEIETPWKKWFHGRSLRQHSDLTEPLNQVAHWKRWFARGRNVPAFYDYYRIPRSLQDLKLIPRYVVVHGRRSEANATVASREFRAELGAGDVRLLTFDHLVPDQRSARYFTVGVDEAGYFIHPNSPSTEGIHLPTDVRSVVRGLPNGEDGRPTPGYRFRPPRPRSNPPGA